MGVFRSIDSFMRGYANGATLEQADTAAGFADAYTVGLVNGGNTKDYIAAQKAESALRNSEGFAYTAGDWAGTFTPVGVGLRTAGWFARGSEWGAKLYAAGKLS